jgi:hypothetical protein
MAVDEVDEHEGKTDGTVLLKSVSVNSRNGNCSLFCDESANMSAILDTIDSLFLSGGRGDTLKLRETPKASDIKPEVEWL